MYVMGKRVICEAHAKHETQSKHASRSVVEVKLVVVEGTVVVVVDMMLVVVVATVMLLLFTKVVLTLTPPGRTCTRSE